MAILFKDNGGDLLTDIDLANPYTNAIKNADNVVGMVDKMQGMFAAQTEKNRLMEKEAFTGAAMADVMAGRELDLRGIDPTALDFNTVMNFAQKKTMDDATVAHQSVMQIEAARAAKASEGSRDIAEENRQLVRLEVTANKKEKLKIEKADQALKAEAAKEKLFGKRVGVVLSETLKDLKGKSETEVNKEIDTMIATGKPEQIAAAEQVMSSMNTSRGLTHKQKITELNSVVRKLKDPAATVDDREAIFASTGYETRAPLPLTVDATDEGNSLLKENTTVTDGSSTLGIPAYKKDWLAFPEGSMKDIVPNRRMLNLDDEGIATTVIADTVRKYEAAIEKSTGKAKLLLENRLEEYLRKTTRGTKVEAVEAAIRSMNNNYADFVRK